MDFKSDLDETNRQFEGIRRKMWEYIDEKMGLREER
jgi:hypothetical protein